jgi:hypothetical protein
MPTHDPQIIIEKHIVIIQNFDLLFLEWTTYLKTPSRIYFFNNILIKFFWTTFFFSPERETW